VAAPTTDASATTTTQTRSAAACPRSLNQRAKSREAYDIWQDYRASVEANDGRGDQDAHDAAWRRAEAWVRLHYPRALTFSLDAVVKGERGISATYPPLADGSIPDYVGAPPEGDGYRQQNWTEGTDTNGHIVTSAPVGGAERRIEQEALRVRRESAPQNRRRR